MRRGVGVARLLEELISFGAGWQRLGLLAQRDGEPRQCFLECLDLFDARPVFHVEPRPIRDTGLTLRLKAEAFSNIGYSCIAI